MITLLHIEDNPAKARSVGRIIQLRYSRVRYIHVETSARGIALIHEEQPDIVISDWELPETQGEMPDGANGAAVVQEACKADVPAVVVFSGRDMPRDFAHRGEVDWYTSPSGLLQWLAQAYATLQIKKRKP